MNSLCTDARADYDKAVVGRDNTWYSDLAAADKTCAVAEAGARRDHDAAGVGAEAGYQRQLAMIDLNWQIALRSGYGSYYTYPIGQLQQSALDQKTHAQQAADLRQAIGNADAALAFAIGMAGSDKTWTKGVASDSKDLRSGLAGADQAYATGMIQPAVTCDLGYMSATIGFWNRERLWGNAWNSAMGAASADFRGADLAARATALSGLASAINNPWARFQSDRANAESAWWSGTATTTGFRATYLQWFANANGAYTLYQDTVNSLYMSHEGSRIAADNSYTADAANATAACENSLADEDKRYQHTMADATHTYVVAAAQTRHDSAIAQAMQALGLATANPSMYSSQLAAAQNAYASSEVGATATWRTGVANANLTYVTDTANCENAWVLNVAGANKTYSIGEATAYAAMGTSLAGHQRTYREQEAQTYATALSTLATASGTPWAQLAADEASARSGYLQTIGQPWLDYTTSLIHAQRDTETAGASALETLIATRANAAKASRIASAQARLALASSLNAADAALLASGRYVPNLPANIVDSLFTASSFPDLTDLTDPSDLPAPSDYQPTRSPDATYDWLLGQAFTTAPCLSSPLTGDGHAWSGYYTPPTNSDSLRDQLIRPKPPEVKLDQFFTPAPQLAADLGAQFSNTILLTRPTSGTVLPASDSYVDSATAGINTWCAPATQDACNVDWTDTIPRATPRGSSQRQPALVDAVFRAGGIGSDTYAQPLGIASSDDATIILCATAPRPQPGRLPNYPRRGSLPRRPRPQGGAGMPPVRAPVEPFNPWGQYNGGFPIEDITVGEWGEAVRAARRARQWEEEVRRARARSEQSARELAQLKGELDRDIKEYTQQCLQRGLTQAGIDRIKEEITQAVRDRAIARAALKPSPYHPTPTGDEVFIPRGPWVLLASARFKDLCEANEVKNALFTSAETYGYDVYPSFMVQHVFYTRVKAGEWIYFHLNRWRNTDDDSTLWDPTIRYDSRPRFVVDGAQRVMVKADLQRMKINFMDASLCVLLRDPESRLFWFHSEDNGNQHQKFLGTLDAPAQQLVFKKAVNQFFTANPSKADGTWWLTNICRHTDGSLLGFIHVENSGQNRRKFRLGLAYATNGGDTWVYLGHIIQQHGDPDDHNITGTPYLIKDGNFYVYFQDADGPSVARAPIREVLKAAKEHKLVPWRKYFEGAFTEPGWGGRSSSIGVENACLHSDAAYSITKRKYVLTGYNHGVGRGVWMAFSDDGIQWTKGDWIQRGRADNPTLSPYVTILALDGTDNARVEDSFYVYWAFTPDWDETSGVGLQNVIRQKVTLIAP